MREWAVRLMFEQQENHESQWAAIVSIAEEMGCAAETLRKWVRQAERDGGQRPGLTTSEGERMKHLLLAMNGPPGGPLSVLFWDCSKLPDDLEIAIRGRMGRPVTENLEIGVTSEHTYWAQREA